MDKETQVENNNKSDLAVKPIELSPLNKAVVLLIGLGIGAGVVLLKAYLNHQERMKPDWHPSSLRIRNQSDFYEKIYQGNLKTILIIVGLATVFIFLSLRSKKDKNKE